MSRNKLSDDLAEQIISGLKAGRTAGQLAQRLQIEEKEIQSFIKDYEKKQGCIYDILDVQEQEVRDLEIDTLSLEELRAQLKASERKNRELRQKQHEQFQKLKTENRELKDKDKESVRKMEEMEKQIQKRDLLIEAQKKNSRLYEEIVERMPDQVRAFFKRKTRSFLAEQITWLNQQGISVKESCSALGMPESTYFKYKAQGPTKTEVQDERILQAVNLVNERTHYLYGYRRMRLALKKYVHLDVSEGSVRRVMRVNNIHSKYRHKVKRAPKRTAPEVVVDNLMDRDFEAREPLMKWSSDVTDLKVGPKAYHICFILDLYCNCLVGWSVSEHNDTNLVLTALKSAFQRYGKPRLFLHSDQGSNYTSSEVQAFLKENSVTSSMSRPGTPLDNAVSESYNSVFKTLYAHLTRPAHNKEELVSNINKTVNFYLNELVTERFGIRSIKEIYEMNLRILQDREEKKRKRAKGLIPEEENEQEIEFFPIAYNEKIGSFWSQVLHLPVSQLRQDYKGMLRQYRALKAEEERKTTKYRQEAV